MERRKLVLIVASIAAVVGWSGLLLQFIIMVPKMGLFGAAWRFVGFFTILTNLGAAAVATAIARGSKSPLVEPRARLMAATSILMVGLVYSIALRALWSPTGVQKIADAALHDVAPLCWLVLWLVAPHPRLPWKETFWALAPPLVYVVYAMIRGAAENWYAYWFLDPSHQTPDQFAISVIVLVAAFGLMAALLVCVDRWIGQPRVTDPDLR